MSITIENAEAEQLVAELSTRMSKQPDELVLDLLRRERERLGDGHDVQRALAESQAVVERWKARPLVDPRSLDEIVAYDEHGLPM